MLSSAFIFTLLSVAIKLWGSDAVEIAAEISYVGVGSQTAVIPYTSANNPCADIRNGQFVCLDCATLAFCLQEDNNWVTIEYEKCRTDKNMFCDDSMRGCTLQRECNVPSYGMKFECQNPGKYPDPYNCRYYHVCSAVNEDTRYVCPSGSAYSAAQKECKLSTDSEECQSAQYTCTRAGETHAWQGDDNIFYVCNAKRTDDGTVLYPVLYRCPDNATFNGVKCVDGSRYPTPPARAAASGSASIAQGDDCNSFGLVANPNNCRSYYRCVNNKYVETECPNNTFYNARRAMCEYGSC